MDSDWEILVTKPIKKSALLKFSGCLLKILIHSHIYEISVFLGGFQDESIFRTEVPYRCFHELYICARILIRCKLHSKR